MWLAEYQLWPVTVRSDEALFGFKGLMFMLSRTAFIAASALVVAAAPVRAGGDLLVAPTRVLLDGARGTEVILNNIGQQPATYRISLELKRMTGDGQVIDITPQNANDAERAALAMISYAPRKVLLPPNQPQAIRIGVRAPAGLPDGEYRAHMLFRAIPDAAPAVAPGAAPVTGLTIALTPIYGVTIPIIIRRGSLTATAALADPKIVKTETGQMFRFKISRTGTRSVYGRIRVTKPGLAKPVFEARGIAVYPELAGRLVELPITPEMAAQMNGPVKIDYLEDTDAGGGMIATLSAVIR
jgi:hypothetical protein